MTVRSGAAGNESAVLNSNIWSSSTMKMKIWCCEYLRSIEMDTVCKGGKGGGCNLGMDEGFLLLVAISPMESGDALLLKFNKREGRVGEDTFEMYSVHI